MTDVDVPRADGCYICSRRGGFSSAFSAVVSWTSRCWESEWITRCLSFVLGRYAGVDPAAAMDMLRNPAVQSMVASMMSNPAMMAQVRV